MQIWGKYESEGHNMKATNEKKIVEMVKKCYNREETISERAHKCKLYNDLCENCLYKCERMRAIISDILESEIKSEKKASKKSQAVKEKKTC